VQAAARSGPRVPTPATSCAHQSRAVCRSHCASQATRRPGATVRCLSSPDLR
jgi:hypothetical protein